MINSNSGEVITLKEGQDFISKFKRLYPEQTKGFFVGANKVEQILQQADCIGIRIYNGYDESLAKTNLVLVGVDSNQKDMTGGIIVERTVLCPDYCDVTSALTN